MTAGQAGRLSDRARWIIAVVAAVALLGGAAVYGAGAWARYQARASADSAVAVSTGAPADGDRIVFRNTASGQGYGLVASVPLADPGAARTLTDRACDRVAATESMELCLRTDRGVLTTFEAVLTGADGETLQQWPLPGIPSRARIGDGMLSTTAFVTGHSYAPTTFSTQTVIRSLDPAVPDPGDLESFALSVAGAPLTAADRNLWGVTFADDGDTFYATAASGSRTWLVRGSMSARTMTAIHDTAECPSLSPDETRVAYKKDVGDGVPDWRIAVLDLASGVETVLPEERSVDDQVVWLDEGTLLYGLPRKGVAGDTDVWSIPADGSGEPELYLEHAWSPSVVRP
ncbi:hypothetical protein [Rathayibacter sp. VKM Ac-2928]|uniref:hypothetical protein n=1 Tax=Rathayibacter sp. VKM Ac-2928 TaxID=2929479 RepID=UPI001FB1FBB7|nr:hypothetical protein [Rathayibacter sp. VKM Ac-2928]MCJ1683268.1 hypothetical protein [Rathayibacter sp. VKM Ac-2928]